MEVVVRRDPRWLVAYFKGHDNRLFLGLVDWSDQKPGIEEINGADGLREFGL